MTDHEYIQNLESRIEKLERILKIIFPVRKKTKKKKNYSQEVRAKLLKR